MSYFYCVSCRNIVTPFKPCTGRWHQDRKSKHMGVIISNKPIEQATIEKASKKYPDIFTYIRTYGYGSCPLPNGFKQKSDLYWPVGNKGFDPLYM
jgi:hypothetical protein